MKLNTALFGSFMVLAISAQAQPYVPPDFYNEPYKNPIGWFANQGQLINENGQPRSDIKFSSVGCVPKACLAKNSQVYFLTYEHGAAPTDPVTVMQVSMKPVGKARKVDPQGVAVKDWYQNFYLPQTAPAGASQVPGYSRVITRAFTMASTCTSTVGAAARRCPS